MNNKEILVEITYYQLYKKKADDGSTGAMLTFYRDGTYAIHMHDYDHERELSLWKMVGNVMWVKHAYIGHNKGTWSPCEPDNEGNSKITQLVLAELAIDRMLTGDLGV